MRLMVAMDWPNWRNMRACLLTKFYKTIVAFFKQQNKNSHIAQRKNFENKTWIWNKLGSITNIYGYMNGIWLNVLNITPKWKTDLDWMEKGKGNWIVCVCVCKHPNSVE